MMACGQDPGEPGGMRMFQDKTVVCQDCGAEFVFSAGEQEYFAAHGLANEPRRCKTCREARKAAGAARDPHEVVCANCGTATVVPFKPREGRPVYCRECFQALRKS